MYPIYLPDTQKLVHHEHLRTLHGGVGLTMTSVRRHHWVPRLRKLVKRTIRGCHGCQKFQARAAANPPPGNLPVDRTQGSHPFLIVGVDYAGPIKYRKHGKVEAKAYIVLYACSLCRALYLDLVPSLETQEFILSLKKLIASDRGIISSKEPCSTFIQWNFLLTQLPVHLPGFLMLMRLFSGQGDRQLCRLRKKSIKLQKPRRIQDNSDIENFKLTLTLNHELNSRYTRFY